MNFKVLNVVKIQILINDFNTLLILFNDEEICHNHPKWSKNFGKLKECSPANITEYSNFTWSQEWFEN